MMTPPDSMAPAFQPGDEVEVTMISESFHGAWYEALVYSRDPNGLYLVVYKALADPADPAQHLREAVPASQVRPRPPPMKALPLALDQPIEAFYKDGWLPGVVWKLPGRQGVRDYEISLNGTEEKFTCRAKLLRRPLDWVNGAWIASAAQEKFNSAQKLGRATSVALKQSSPAFSSISACDNTDQLLMNAKKEETEGDVSQSVNSMGGYLVSSTGFEDTVPRTLFSRDSGEREAEAGKRRKKNTPRKSGTQKRNIVDLNTSVRDSAGVLVDTPSAELVTQGNTPMKAMTPCSILLGTSNFNSTPKVEIAGFVAPNSTPKVEIAGFVAPKTNELHSTTIPLPFEKRSPLWKYIDTEITPKMMRHPHFRPLEQYPEAQREGFAIGLMVTYDYLMNGKYGMQRDGNMKIITDLEEYGFEVQHLQMVQSYYEQLTQKSEVEMKENSHGLDAELEATDRAVLTLNQALDLFNERRASLLKQRGESETSDFEVQRDLSLAVKELAMTVRSFQDTVTGI